jgi:outer membrane protein TolC
LAFGQSGAGAAQRLSLDSAIKMAVENNRQLQTAQFEIKKADANVGATKTRRLPALQVEAQASQLLTPVKFSFPQAAFGEYPGIGPIPSIDTTLSVLRQPTYYLFTQLSQPISQLFRLGLGVQNATTTREIDRERARSQRLSVVNNVKRLYFSILQMESALSATDEAIAMYRELDKSLQVRVAQKVALRSDALDVQFRLAEEELSRTTQQNALASQKEQLNQLLGRDVRAAFEVEGAAAIALRSIDVQAEQAHALENRPDIREARLRVQQAELDIRLTKSEWIPDISAIVSYTSNFNIDVLPANLAMAGIHLKWEPFDWGRKRHEVAGKAQALEQARLAVRDAEDRTVIEINSRFRTLAEKRALLRVAEMAQSTASERMRVKTNQYQVQAALLPDVLQSRADVADANDRYQQALLAFWTAKADYDLAIGEEGLQ